jgi:dTDP-4-amino-4,6-dideoxygalactose transaminase
MTRSWSIAQAARSVVIEDAAQGFLARYRESTARMIGHMRRQLPRDQERDFGEGGALLTTMSVFARARRIIWEKARTDAILRGEVNK